MNVSQIMRQPAVVIHEDTSLEEAARIMLEHKLRVFQWLTNRENYVGLLVCPTISQRINTFLFRGFTRRNCLANGFPPRASSRCTRKRVPLL